jgi:hypothetical protein
VVLVVRRSDINRLRMDLGLSIPRIEATGTYEVVGQVLLFPVRSRGEFWALFSKQPTQQFHIIYEIEK